MMQGWDMNASMGVAAFIWLLVGILMIAVLLLAVVALVRYIDQTSHRGKS